MENKQKKLAKNAVIYSFFSLLQRGLGFFLLPVYTTVLAKDELGTISTATAIVAFFVILFGLSLRGAVPYYYYEYKDKKPHYLKKLYGTSTLFILCFTSLGIISLLATREWFLDYLFENIAFMPYILLSLISIFLQPLYFFYQSILKAKQEAKKASALDFAYFGIMVGLTLVLILGFNLKAEGALIANAVASFFVFIISIIGLNKEISWHFSTKILKKVLKYSLPLVPHNISGWAMNMMDKVLLNSMTSLTLVGLFDVGSQIGKVVNMISLGVNSAYAPWFFDQVKNDPNSKTNIVTVTHKIVLFYVFIGVAISWIAPELLHIISKPEYYEAWTIVPLIATAFVINGFYFTFSSVFFLEKTKHLFILTMIGAVANLILNLIMIPSYGILGAAIASILTKVFFTCLTYWFSQRIYHLPYNTIYIISIITVGFVLSMLPYIIQERLDQYNLWVIGGIKCFILTIFGGYLLLHELKDIKGILKK